MFVDVRDPNTGKLLFRFDPARDLVEVRRRGVISLIDLSTYRGSGQESGAAQRPARRARRPV